MKKVIKPHTAPNPAALREREAAYYSGFSTAFLRQSRMKTPPDGHSSGPPWIKVGRSVRYLISDLDQWLESRRVGQGTEGGNHG